MLPVWHEQSSFFREYFVSLLGGTLTVQLITTLGKHSSYFYPKTGVHEVTLPVRWF